MRAILVSLLALGLSVAASNAATPPPIVKVSVLSDGRLLVDGAPSTIDGLRSRLESAKAGHGSVLYYREGAERAPTRQADATISRVLDAVVSFRLPISLSTKADFSDAVDDQGVSRQRAAQ